jgi:hypothetical protein
VNPEDISGGVPEPTTTECKNPPPRNAKYRGATVAPLDGVGDVPHLRLPFLRSFKRFVAPPTTGGDQEGSVPRSWWRRIFEG